MAAQKGIGRLIQLGIAKETTRGTGVTNPAYWVPFADAAPESKIENVTDETVYGIIEDSVSQTRVKDWMEGNIVAPVRDQHFGLILLSMLGNLSSHAAHAGETIVFDNIFKVGESAQHKSLTLSKSDPLSAQNYYYPLTVVHKLDIEFALKKFITYTAGITGLKGVSISNQSAPSNTSENYFVPQYLTFKYASTYGGLSGGTTVQLKSAKISIDDNLEHQEVLGATAPADFLNKSFKVEGEFTAIWQNESDAFTNFIANTPQALRFDLINTDVTLGNSTHPELLIDFAKCYFTELSKPIKINDLVYQTVKFKAVYSLSDSLMLQVTLTNLVNGY